MSVFLISLFVPLLEFFGTFFPAVGMYDSLKAFSKFTKQQNKQKSTSYKI